MKKRTLLTLGALAAVIVGGAGLTLSKAVTTQVHAQATTAVTQAVATPTPTIAPQVKDSQADGEVPDSQEKNGGKVAGQDTPEGVNDVAD